MKLISGIALALFFACETQAFDGIRYAPAPDHTEGQVIMHARNAGQYIYAPPEPDGRNTNTPRFSMGKPIRQDFRLLGAIEEKAMWDLQETLRDKTTKETSTLFRARKKQVAPIVWPKVAYLEGKGVCVPRLKHQNEIDWLKNSVCFNKDTNNVE